MRNTILALTGVLSFLGCAHTPPQAPVANAAAPSAAASEALIFRAEPDQAPEAAPAEPVPGMYGMMIVFPEGWIDHRLPADKPAEIDHVLTNPKTGATMTVLILRPKLPLREQVEIFGKLIEERGGGVRSSTIKDDSATLRFEIPSEGRKGKFVIRRAKAWPGHFIHFMGEWPAEADDATIKDFDSMVEHARPKLAASAPTDTPRTTPAVAPTLEIVTPKGWHELLDPDGNPPGNAHAAYIHQPNPKRPPDGLIAVGLMPAESGTVRQAAERFAKLNVYRPGPIHVDPDGNRAWFVLAGEDGNLKKAGKVVVKRMPKNPGIIVVLIGEWNASASAALTADYGKIEASLRWK